MIAADHAWCYPRDQALHIADRLEAYAGLLRAEADADVTRMARVLWPEEEGGP